MFDSGELVRFLGIASVLVIAPGPNTVLILTNSLAGGRSAGFATVAGVETGTLVHTLAAAVGISALLATSTVAFDIVKYGGAAYLVYLGMKLLVTRASAADPPQRRVPRLRSTFNTAVIASVLNPKSAVFFLALLPQFVRPERGHVMVQFLVLGGIVSMVGVGVGGILTLAASRAQAWLTRACASRLPERALAGVLIALAVRLALTGRD